jgi:glucokinase
MAREIMEAAGSEVRVLNSAKLPFIWDAPAKTDKEDAMKLAHLIELDERNRRYFAGIDVGGTHFAIGVVDGDGKLLAKHTMPTGAGRPFRVIVKEMADTAKQLIAREGLAESRIAGVGIGVPSTIDSKTGRLIFANNLDWRDLDLIGEFRKSWNIPVYVENDADCAALAESMDDAAKGKNTLLITFGTGFGGGLIMNGKIFKGGDNSGFEPGHFVLVHKGVQCTCGNYGCVEAYASVSALVRETKEKMRACPDGLMWKECGADPEKVNGHTSFDAAKKGDAGIIGAALLGTIGPLVNP